MSICTSCGRVKKPIGRDEHPAASGSHCTYDCPGYTEPPFAGYLWPSELTHYWWYKKWLPERTGQPCRVLARGNGRGPRNVLVEFLDGFRAVSARFCVRRLPV